MSDRSFTIIGGGPAGLTAAYELSKRNIPTTVLEKGKIVGGIARTENYKGYHFDMGGHRFFTKSEEVNKMWHEVLLNEFLQRPRLSRIYYKQKFFNYPLKPMNALAGLGVFESILIGCSYARWRMFPYKVEESLEQWVTNRFGKRLFLTFFKTYTEKVWGIPCSELKAEWAAQRIKDLDLKAAIISMFIKPKKTIKTLIEQFDYPRLGPGMMWNAVRSQIEQRGAKVMMETDCTKIIRNGNRIDGVVVGCNGQQQTIKSTDYISSMPLTEFVKKLDPPAPANVLEAAGKLKYRDFLTVCIIVNKKDLFPDNWIYIHEASVQVGRIQNFKNWSPNMVADENKTSLGLEYFCNEGDQLWTMSDKDLVELARQEIDKIGLANKEDVEDGCVFRVPKSYPVYDSDYVTYLGVIRDYVDSLVNFKTIGRNGLHRYNNQDHSMLTGMYAVRNLMDGKEYDLWKVNADKEYHEISKEAPADDMAGVEQAVKAGLSLVLEKFDRVATGAAAGVLIGAALFLATLFLVIKGGSHPGQNLQLLGQYFPGYKVSVSGSFLGLLYGGMSGFVFGYLFAMLTNLISFMTVRLIQRRAKQASMWNVLEYI